MTRVRLKRYQGAGGAMLRAAVNLTGPEMPPWPEPTAPLEQWRSWLATVWADDTFRPAVSGASPGLARRIESVLAGRAPKARRVRRAALSLARYAIRYAHRPTPYGLFAGVAPAEFGDTVAVYIGGRHEATVRPDPVALDAAVSGWEANSERMGDVEVCVNTLVQRRGGRAFVPSEGASEFSLALTPALILVLDAARAPIRTAALASKLAAAFPDTSERDRAGLIGELLRVRLLRSALRAPATVTDPTDGLPPTLRAAGRATPAAPDLRLDAAVRLPRSVLTEAETAATVLARLAAYPNGIPAWRRWAERFIERYGEGAEIPVELVTNPEGGLGFPDGFGRASEPPRPMARRDRLLLELAGTAAVEGARSVALSGAMIEELEAAAGTPALVAPHLELGASVHARSARALERGDFRLRVSTVSRAAGSMTGRFWHLFPGVGATYAGLPTVEPGAELVQLSFHAGRVSADLLTRAPRVLPRLVSVGEFRRPGDDVLFPADLVVGVRDGRLYLAETATGRHLEVLAPTALNFLWNNYTPPLVRFLAEISRAAAPQVTWFDWGAAWTLPFTPALTHRRSILVAARWKVRARDLPGRTAATAEWTERLRAWTNRFQVPGRVLLAEDDQLLPLDLDRPMDVDLLRAHLDASPTGVVSLHEAPPAGADSWIDGRAHNLVIPLKARS